MFLNYRLFGLIILSFAYATVSAQDKRSFKVFQFPSNMIPTIDGKIDDWGIVPEEYSIGMDQLFDDRDGNPHLVADPKNLDVKVKVGWVKGMNRLYFLYQAYDDYWDFSLTDLHNDIFEVVVDGDQSGGPFAIEFHPNKDIDTMDAYTSFHGVHAQNYHIFTPAEGKEWAYVWGDQQWIKKLPYANAAYDYNFTPGDSGSLTLEFWITAFDYAGPEGPGRAVESVFYENKNIGLSWAVLDYDDVNAKKYNGFWNLSKERSMYGNATYLLPFRLMPLDSRFVNSIEAEWSFKVVDKDRRIVWFLDESIGDISSWKWDFGDGEFSTEQHPVHSYKKSGMYTVTLWINGPSGRSRMAKVWEVVVK